MGLNYLASLSHFVPELLACVTMFGLILIEATYKEETMPEDKKYPHPFDLFK